MIKSILAPTDLSPRGDLALRRAFRLGAAHGAAITVQHVIDDAAPQNMQTLMHEAVEATLTQFTDTLKGDTECRIAIDIGDPTTDILDRIEALGPDLVVMGTHRIRPIFDSVGETTAQRITRLTSRPVLLVSDRDDHAYDVIAAATDFSPAAAAAAAMAHRIAPLAAIHPVHAYPTPFSGIAAQTKDGLNEIKASFRLEAEEADTAWRASFSLPRQCAATELFAGSPYQVLASFVANTGATLITAGAHGRVGARRALLGSLATDLLRQPLCDTLIARPD